MIEVVIGIAVVVVLAISLITTTLITQKTATSAKNNSQATKLAQKTSEEIRIYRDRVGFNSTKFSSLNGCYKLVVTNSDPSLWDFPRVGDDCTTVTGDEILLDNVKFDRKIQIVDKSSTEKETTVTITWTESAGVQSVVHKSLITSWCSGEIVAGGPCSAP